MARRAVSVTPKTKKKLKNTKTTSDQFPDWSAAGQWRCSPWRRAGLIFGGQQTITEDSIVSRAFSRAIPRGRQGLFRGSRPVQGKH